MQSTFSAVSAGMESVTYDDDDEDEEMEPLAPLPREEITSVGSTNGYGGTIGIGQLESGRKFFLEIYLHTETA